MKKRLDDLEKTMPTTNEHKYLMVIGWGETKIEPKYYRDGESITRAEYQREAPKEPGKINIHWGEAIPPREEADDENDKKTSG